MDIVSIALAAAMLMFPVKDAMEQPVRMLTVEQAQMMVLSEEEAFRPMAWTSRPVTALSLSYGYITLEYDISRADFTENSALYLAHAKVSFVPGYAAHQNGFEYVDGVPFEENAYLKSGFVQLELVDSGSSGHAKGTPKAMWPNSSDFQTTFSSSYGGTLSISNTLESGLELGNGGILKANVGGSTTTGMSLSFSKQTSTLTDDPYVSAQYENNNPYCASWNYEVVEAEIAGKVTYTIDVYLLTEITSNGGSGELVSFKITSCFNLQQKRLFGWSDIQNIGENGDPIPFEAYNIVDAYYYN